MVGILKWDILTSAEGNRAMAAGGSRASSSLAGVVARAKWATGHGVEMERATAASSKAVCRRCMKQQQP